MRKRHEFNATSIAIRFAIALVLVFATYNPSGWSYVHWAIMPLPAFSPVKAVAGIVLVIGYTMFLRATARSLGIFGVFLAITFFGVLIWLIVDVGILPLDSVTAVTWVVLFVFACVLAIGMSWSHIRRRLAGQFDTDDVDIDE
ncbi:MAG: hypothetical protein DRR03_08340 [Gammaproteobacteria bacterium]|nr:MAG: hypothetical protein DRR03_08340 [Gammaproteobacteria bacterium]